MSKEVTVECVECGADIEIEIWEIEPRKDYYCRRCEPGDEEESHDPGFK